jgi:hypothetical protein
MKKLKTLLDLTHLEARQFLLKGESYCNFDLPQHFNFNQLIADTDKFLAGKNLKDFFSNKPSEFESVNHVIHKNKDGKYSWRPFELINPALYVALVQRITEPENWKLILSKFAEFQKNKKIECVSIPITQVSKSKDRASQILNWWKEVEQKSIVLSLEYDHMIQIDLADCYGSIYSHTIAWALHTKKTARKSKDEKLIGNYIDLMIQNMRNGQTNGIPQGSVLMDFFAEIILGYVDDLVSEKLSKSPLYKILRYRDDYRVFTNNPQQGKEIVKLISEVLLELGLKINQTKTRFTDSVLIDSIKEDKVEWLINRQQDENLQKQLLIIYKHSLKYPNTGSLEKPLQEFYKDLEANKQYFDALSLIAIIVDIAFRNPRTYPICSAILSKLLLAIGSTKDRKSVIAKIIKKFRKLPNSGHMEIWLQRVTLSLDATIHFEEKLCKLVKGEINKIWNDDWISSKDLKKVIDARKIIIRDQVRNAPAIIAKKEVDLFHIDDYEY